MQRIFIKKCFLLTVGSVCRVKRFTTGWQKFRLWRRGSNTCAEVAEITIKRPVCCGFWRTCKVVGQAYQGWWRIYREINAFLQFRISQVLRFISICDLLTDSPLYSAFPGWGNELLKGHRVRRFSATTEPFAASKGAVARWFPHVNFRAFTHL
jgi:hypothetical protein